MRLISVALALAIAFFSSPSSASPTTGMRYVVRYGTLMLGAWGHLTLGKSKVGKYDGTSFDTGTGPGYRTLTVSRALIAADKAHLFASLNPGNVPLVVRSYKNNLPYRTLTCPKSYVSDFGTEGDPGTGTETLAFACTTVTNVASKY
jgi:hypothetical protein